MTSMSINVNADAFHEFWVLASKVGPSPGRARSTLYISEAAALEALSDTEPVQHLGQEVPASEVLVPARILVTLQQVITEKNLAFRSRADAEEHMQGEDA